MPQLDKVTFFSQFFWLCVFFLGFYIIIHKYFLPRISRILKLRKKKITMSLLSFAHQEIDQLRASKDTLLQESLKLSGLIFAEGSKLIHTSRDTSKVIQLLNEKYKNKPFFFTSEKLYVEFVGQSFVSNKSLLQLYSPDCAASPHSQLFEIYRFLQKKTQYNSRLNWSTRRSTGDNDSGEQRVSTLSMKKPRKIKTDNFGLRQTKKRAKKKAS